MSQTQARFWLLTIRHADFLPFLPPNVDYIRGQLELGDGGFLHWQIVVHFARKTRLGGVKTIFGDSAHAEPTRSDAVKIKLKILIDALLYERSEQVSRLTVSNTRRLGSLNGRSFTI